MLICAIDTSGREGSVALAEGDAASFRVLQVAAIAGGTYSAQLIPQITSVLAACGREKADIGLLVAASGPGSFTGLRVGLSTVKALSEVLHTPITGVSVLEAIAFAAGKSGLVLAALDAQRNEIFVGEYDIQTATANSPARASAIEEALVSGSDFITWLSARKDAPVTYTPDLTVATLVRESGLAAEQVPRPNAEIYARAGLYKFLAGVTVATEELDANYIRRSDAEIFSAPKLGIRPK
jgi:tRNA threonylcarbamoyladenosine biosynthesis protein TsaB